MASRSRSYARAGTVAACVVSALTFATPAAAAAGCERLNGLWIPPGAIGLPTSGATVLYAVTRAPSGSGVSALPEHCEVMGSIAPVDVTAPAIQFKLALPGQWNGKAVMLGGGGFNGSIPDVKGNVSNGAEDRPLPLARGYATFASDSGHQALLFGAADGLFALNDEALRNFAGDALKKTRDAAMVLIQAHYGVAPTKAYVAGGSTGGREALTAIQRWPADWDGAIAWYPAWNDMSALLSGVRISRALARPGAYPSGAKRAVLQQAALETCDGLDGVRDGLISDQTRCNAIFDPLTATLGGVPLRCPNGADTGDSCLSDAQIAALTAITEPTRFRFPMASGETGYPGFNVWGADLGITTRTSRVQPTVNQLTLNLTQPASLMAPTAPFISFLVDQTFKYMVTRNVLFDTLSLDPEAPGAWAPRISMLSAGLDASTDIASFKARGGKLLLAHGLVDVLVSPRGTQDYYQRLQARFGAGAVDQFVRYYEIAGFGHGVSSDFNATWDALGALEQWAEGGVAPSGQTTTDTVGVPGRTRPLCDFPKWVRYEGTGSVDQASSFSCVR